MKEAAAVLDAQRGDTRGALEAAQAKVGTQEEAAAGAAVANTWWIGDAGPHMILDSI